MSQFTHVIFDLDGTLTDNTEGINNSLKYALEQMHVDGYNDDILKSLIGPPLQWGFKNVFGMNERDTKLAVEYFRAYYGEHGWHQNVPYDGIMEMMAELDAQGKKMYIATAKFEKFALKIIEHFEMDKYIIQHQEVSTTYKDSPIIYWQQKTYSGRFYSERPTLILNKVASLDSLLRTEDKFFLLITEKQVKHIPERVMEQLIPLESNLKRTIYSNVND